jgi:hypothetical protein
MAHPLDKKDLKLGMRVQDAWGEVGTVRWIGTFTKGGPSGNFCGVEFDVPKVTTVIRTDGVMAGNRYFTCAPRTGEFTKAKYLERETITKALAQMVAIFPDSPPSVMTKFLLARKCNVTAASEMFNKHLQWRAANKPSHQEVIPRTIAEDYPIGWHGFDKEGNLLHVERPGNGGKCLPSALIKRYGIPGLIRWHITMMETVMTRLQEAGAKRCTIIVDLTNLGSVGSKTIDYAKQIAAVDQDNYPENIAKLFIINAPGFFTAVWAIVKNFLDARTRDKIYLFGTSGYKDTLLEYIPAENIPSCAGGKNDAWFVNGGGVGMASDAVAPPMPDSDIPDDDDKPIC